jgi:type I restriction enzyme S subunit
MMFELGRGRVLSNEEILENQGPYPVYSSQTKDNGVLGCVDTYDFNGDYITWTTDGANAGTVSRRKGKFNCTNVCGTLRSTVPDCDLDFYAYALSKATSWFVRHDINPKLMNNVVAGIHIPRLSLAEQTQIARFLDYETARIDALIAEQERLIELLKEKRQAVISHAVTKGLDPTAPMKDSGVEWLGEVPEHWKITKLKYVVTQYGGSTPSKENLNYWDGDIPWITPKDMKKDIISDSIDHVSESAIRETNLSVLPPQVVLIVVRGMILAHSVPVAVTTVTSTINQDMKAMTTKEEISPDYLSLLLQGIRNTIFGFIDNSAHGTKKIEWERFESISIPLPCQDEQKRIIAATREVICKIDELHAQINEALNILNERRSALISAAVTGKIDVRGWQPPASVAPSPVVACG